MLLEKRRSRQRRKIKLRNHQKLPRLIVFRSEKHIYGQIVDTMTGKILTSASSSQKDIKFEGESKSYNVAGAAIVGEILGKKAKEAGVLKLVFDRGGYQFHGRVKSFADSVRKNVEI